MESPLRVVLAGMNIDVQGLEMAKDCLAEMDLIEEERSAIHRSLSQLTPETISASYARISRDPRTIPELRAVARDEVEKARATNQNLIFTMGHRSIAEHVFFNFDVMGLSRRAVEELEKKRLQSYTEKSQRYISLKGDFVIPQEIQSTPFEREFVQLIEEQNKFYNDNLETLTAWHTKQNPETDLTKPSEKARIEGYGKEDARYALAMATQAQVGLSLTARNLERLITETRSSESEEVRNLGGQLLKEVKGIAPSVVKYIEPVDYYKKTRGELREFIEEKINENIAFISHARNPVLASRDIKLFTGLSRDNSILAGLVFSSSDISFNESLEMVRQCLSEKEKREIFDLAGKYQERHDPLLREYELGDRVAEITLSSSAFAQLKRHRMNTLIPQEYNPSISHTVPASVAMTELGGELWEIVEKSSELYWDMRHEGLPTIVAEYALTNAHRRRVLLDANNRQIYAICAEREHLAAQWDIRNLTKELHGLIQKESPLTMAHLCGKDNFDALKADRYKTD